MVPTREIPRHDCHGSTRNLDGRLSRILSWGPLRGMVAHEVYPGSSALLWDRTRHPSPLHMLGGPRGSRKRKCRAREEGFMTRGFRLGLALRPLPAGAGFKCGIDAIVDCAGPNPVNNCFSASRRLPRHIWRPLAGHGA